MRHLLDVPEAQRFIPSDFCSLENDKCFSNSGFWSSTYTHAIWFEFQWRDLMFPGQHVGISLRTTWQWPNTVKYTVMSATHINQVPSMLLSVGWMHTWKVPPPVMRILSACSSTSASSKISVPAHSHISLIKDQCTCTQSHQPHQRSVYLHTVTSAAPFASPPCHFTSPPCHFTSPPCHFTSPPCHFTSTPRHFTSPPRHFTSPPCHFTSPPCHFTSPPCHFTSPPCHFTSPPCHFTSPPHFISQHTGHAACFITTRTRWLYLFGKAQHYSHDVYNLAVSVARWLYLHSASMLGLVNKTSMKC